MDRHFLPDSFGLALSPRLLCNAVRVDDCKIMNSKQAPLWVVLRHDEDVGIPGGDEGNKLLAIFKVGWCAVVCCRLVWCGVATTRM